MDYSSFLNGPGFGAKSEADPYGLGDYGTGSVIGNSGLYKYGDESQDSFLQRLYTKASDPNSGFGTAGRSFADMQNAGLYNTLDSVDIGGQSFNRIGENLNDTFRQQEGNIQQYFDQRGGPGATYNDQYGWIMPTQKYADMTKLADYNHRKMAGFSDWLPTLFGMAATAGVGALGSGAAVAAEGAAGGGAAGGAGGGIAGISEGTAGALARGAVSTAGSTMNGGSPVNGLIGMAGTLAGGYFGGTSGIGSGGEGAFNSGTNSGGGMDWGSGLAEDANMDPAAYEASQVAAGGGDLGYQFGTPNMSGLDYADFLRNAAGSSGTGTTAASLLARLFSGNTSGAGGSSGIDWARLLGGAGSAALGYMGGNAQIDAYKQMQDRFLGLGAPSRARLEASYQPGFDMAASDPAYQGAMDQSANSVLRKLSASGGNPWDSPGALMEANKYVTQSTALPQLNAYRSANASSGGLGVNTAGTAAGGAAGAAGGPYDAIGAGLYNVTKPQGTTLEDLARQYKLSSGWNN